IFGEAEGEAAGKVHAVIVEIILQRRLVVHCGGEHDRALTAP
nr:hypothetical protein [Tanacetum cinerariifolium]